MDRHQLPHLPYFVRAAELGNFSAVARDFGVSAVAISKSIATLEASLGVRLFQRSTRSVSLTAEGRNLYERCAGPIRALEQAGQSAKQEADTPAGPVRVTCVKPFGKGYVIPLLKEFGRMYPRVRIEFALDDRTVDMVKEGFDIGVRAGAAPGPAVVAREICPLTFVVCASPVYFAHYGVPKTLADLERHNCMRMGLPPAGERATVSGGGNGFSWRTGDLTAQQRVEVSGNFCATDFVALESAALGGLGLMQAPLPMVLPHFRTGSLYPVLPQAMFSGLSICLHYRSRKNLPLRTRLLIDFLLEHLRQQPDLKGSAKSLCAPFWARQ